MRTRPTAIIPRKARTPEHLPARIFILPRFMVVLGARKHVLGGANGEDGGAISTIGPGNDEDGAGIFIIPPGKNIIGSTKVNLGASKDNLRAGIEEDEPRFNGSAALPESASSHHVPPPLSPPEGPIPPPSTDRHFVNSAVGIENSVRRLES